MSNLEETKKFLEKHCLQRCNHNANESCICKVAICFKEIEKAQEQEKVLDIIKKKRIDIESFYKTFIEDNYDYNDYEICYGTYGLELLTEEEFDLLKRWLG